ncbi:hypothetical protein HD806DRAFT_541916 [Xylariaceae sp. AK1471]|nr:hypothetical protein HD806DRAFT_541916 [Xylariaceae sp. AK1471]
MFMIQPIAICSPIDIVNWLYDNQHHDIPFTKSRKHARQETPRPVTSEASVISLGISDNHISDDQPTTPRNKRTRPNDDSNDDAERCDIDPNRTPVAPPSVQSDSYSTTSGDTSTSTSTSRRPSPVKRLLRLEIAPQNPLSLVLINRRDPRMPRELKTMLAQLETFQRGDKVVPRQLANEVEKKRASQKDEITNREGATGVADDSYNEDDDGDFYNFRPAVYSCQEEAPFWHPILLDNVLDILTATQMCTNDVHPESSWNMLVHWPIFKLALGTAGTDIPTTTITTIMTKTAAAATTPTTTAAGHKPTHMRVSCVPCTTARLTGRNRGTKMVDFCIALEPVSSPLVGRRIRELRARADSSTVNHTDFYPLRNKPIIISAESKKPGEGLLEAQTQVGAWQAAQWSLLDLQRQGGGDVTSSPSFLPALFIQGSQWSFAATTRQSTQTLLWTQQSIGATDTVLGIFQIIRALRHIAQWSATTYWQWYQNEVLAIDKIAAAQ